MLKQNRNSIILLALLIIVAAFYYFSRKGITFKKEEAVFAVSHISDITRIIVSNSDSIVTICKSEGNWLVNDQLNANPEMVELCLKVLSGVEIKSALPKQDNEKIRTLLLKYGSNIKVFENDRLIQHCYIMSHAKTQTVYMMLALGQKPYIVKLPSFDGNFAGLFKMPLTYWRDNALVRLAPSQIASVKVEQVENQKQSFELLINNNNKIVLRQLKEKDFSPCNLEAAEAYLMCFKKVQLVSFINKKETFADSIKKCKALFKVSILDRSGRITQFSTYPKLKYPKLKEGIGISTDPNFCYVLINGLEPAIVKYVEIDPITRDFDFFKK